MKTQHKIILVAVVAALAVGGKILLSHKQASAPVSNVRPASLSVTAVTPTRVVWPQTVPAQGAIAAWQESTVSTEIGGLRIAQVLVDVGSQVKRGQELATLSQESVTANVHKQEAAVAQANASLAQAKSDAERARVVSSSGALSEQKIQEYLIAEETAQANLASAQAALESARIDLNRTHILAPDDGMISSRTASVGTVVNAGTELFKMVRQNRLEWRAEVAAPQLGGLQTGQKAVVTLPQGGEIAGKVRMVAPTLSADTRTALVYVDLPHGSLAKAGMYAEGRLELGQREALTLPISAVVLRDGMNYVFEIGQGNLIDQRQVKTGRREGDRVEIVSGLSPQARIAATGGAFLNQGDRVNVVPDVLQNAKQ
jgi:RND family efflux transporter MFP subunit